MATYNDRSGSHDVESDEENGPGERKEDNDGAESYSDGRKTATSRVTCNFDLHPPSSRPSTAATVPAPPQPNGREPSPRVPRLPLGDFNNIRPATSMGYSATDRPVSSNSTRAVDDNDRVPSTFRPGSSKAPTEFANLDEKFNELKNRMHSLRNRNDMLKGPTQINDIWNEMVDTAHVFQMERKHLNRQVKALQHALMISESKRTGADDKMASSQRLQQEQFAFVKKLRHPYDLEKKCKVISDDIKEHEKYLRQPKCRAEFTSRPSNDSSAEAVFVHLLEQRMRLTDDLVFTLKKRLQKYEENEALAVSMKKHGSIEEMLEKMQNLEEEVKALKDAERQFFVDPLIRSRDLSALSKRSLCTMVNALQRELRVCYDILDKCNYTRNPHLKWLAEKKVVAPAHPHAFDDMLHFDDELPDDEASSGDDGMPTGMGDLETLTEKNMNLQEEVRRLQDVMAELHQERRLRDKSAAIHTELLDEIAQRRSVNGFLTQKEVKIKELAEQLDEVHKAHRETIDHLTAVQHTNTILEEMNQELVHKKENLLRNTLLLSHKLLKNKEENNVLKQKDSINRSRLSGFFRLCISLTRSLTVMSGTPMMLRARHHYAEYLYRDFFCGYLQLTSAALRIQAWYRRLSAAKSVQNRFGKSFSAAEIVRPSPQKPPSPQKIEPSEADHAADQEVESIAGSVISAGSKPGSRSSTPVVRMTEIPLGPRPKAVPVPKGVTVSEPPVMSRVNSVDNQKPLVAGKPPRHNGPIDLPSSSNPMADSLPLSVMTTASSRPSTSGEADVADTLVPYREDLESLFTIAGLTYPRTEVEWVDCIKRLAIVRLQNESADLDQTTRSHLIEKYLRQCDQSDNQRLRALMRRHAQGDHPVLPTLEWHMKNSRANVTEVHRRRMAEYEARKSVPPKIPRSLFSHLKDSIVYGTDVEDTVPAIKKMFKVSQVLKHELRTILVPFVQARLDEFLGDLQALSLEVSKLQDGNRTYWRNGGVQATKGTGEVEMQTETNTRTKKIMAGESMFEQDVPADKVDPKKADPKKADPKKAADAKGGKKKT